MALDQALLDLMPISIQVRHRTGQNRYNEPTYATAIEYQARIEPVAMRQGRENEEARWITARIIVDAQGTLTDTDMVMLPDGSSPDVVSVTTEYDEHGVHHQTYLIEG